MNNALTRLLVPALTALLSGCFTSDERHAGVDDFPNSIYSKVNAFLGESQSGAVALSPQAQPLVNVQAGGVPGGKVAAGGQGALAEFTAGDTIFAVDTSTKAQGYVTWLAVVTDSVKKTHLEAKVRWDAQAQDTIKDNENILRWKSTATWNVGSRFESVESEDADGDSLVNATSPQSKSRVSIRVSDSGVVSRAELIAGPGADKDFDTEADNVLYLARWWAMWGQDTLFTAEYLDADGDSVVVDNADTSLVILDFHEFNPMGKPEVAEGRIRLRTRARYQQKGELTGLWGEEKMRNGRSKLFVLTDLQGRPEVNLKDTVLGRFTEIGAPSDTLDTLQGEIRTTLGDFEKKDDDRIHALTLTVVNKMGPERRGQFSFISSTPMLPDTKPRDGRLVLRLDYDDNTSLILDGTLEAGAMTAMVTLRDGRMFRGRWDASGRLLEWKAN